MKVIVWECNLQPQIKDVASGDSMLATLQGLVHGYVQSIPTHIPDTYLYLNEDGKHHGFETNVYATVWCRVNKLISPSDHIVGTVVIVKVDPATGMEVEVDEEIIFELSQFTEKFLVDASL